MSLQNRAGLVAPDYQRSIHIYHVITSPVALYSSVTITREITGVSLRFVTHDCN